MTVDPLGILFAAGYPVVNSILGIGVGVVTENLSRKRAYVDLFCLSVDFGFADLDFDLGFTPKLSLFFKEMDQLLFALVDSFSLRKMTGLRWCFFSR